MSVHEKIGSELKGFGGHLNCETCGHQQELGNAGKYMRTGWPKHCGQTLRWITQNEIDAAKREGREP